MRAQLIGFAIQFKIRVLNQIVQILAQHRIAPNRAPSRLKHDFLRVLKRALEPASPLVQWKSPSLLEFRPK